MTIPVQTSPTRIIFAPARESGINRFEPARRQRHEIAADIEVPHLSYSQIKRFAQCPLQWKLSREYAPAFVPAALVFGGGYHASLEAYYQARLEGRDVAMDELLAVFDRHWADETERKRLPVKFTAKAEDAAALRELASRMITAFLASVQLCTVVALEEAFSITLAPDLPPVVGKIDLVEIREDADGVRRAWLVDFKTAARKPSSGDLDSDQLLLYGLAATQMGWAKSLGMPLGLRFDIITKTASPACMSVPVEPSERDTARFIEKARQCHRAMKAGVCYPSPGWQCGGCGHAHLCAAWPKLPAAQAA